jgi:hypothetical protein
VSDVMGLAWVRVFVSRIQGKIEDEEGEGEQ